jgi:hypothetical protein
MGRLCRFHPTRTDKVHISGRSNSRISSLSIIQFYSRIENTPLMGGRQVAPFSILTSLHILEGGLALYLLVRERVGRDSKWFNCMSTLPNML